MNAQAQQPPRACIVASLAKLSETRIPARRAHIVGLPWGALLALTCRAVTAVWSTA